jgi:hypothetical protein
MTLKKNFIMGVPYFVFSPWILSVTEPKGFRVSGHVGCTSEGGQYVQLESQTV